MKTAISILDALFARVDGKAAVLGLSRSAFFAIAAERYLDSLDSLDNDGLTERVNDVLAAIGGDRREEAVLQFNRYAAG